jgi:ribosomal protein S18 acetylase RimI-like enzyme
LYSHRTSQLLERVVIRTAQRSDLPALEWDGEYSHFRLLYRDIYQGVLRGDAVMWVAESDSVGVIGQLFVQLIASRVELADGRRRAYLYGFRIKTAYRKQGLGGRMLDHVEEELSERGYRLMNLNVAKDNVQARRFYENRGYHVIASEPGRWSYIDDRGHRQQVNEPAWRMEKDLLGYKVC